MLFHALMLALIWLLLSAIILLIAGRKLGGPAPFFSIVLALVIEGAGGALAIKLGIPRNEVIICAAIGILPAMAIVFIFPHWNPAGHVGWLFLAEASALYLSVAAVITILVPMGFAGHVLGMLLLVMQCAAILMMLSYSHELIDVICRRRWRWPEARPQKLASGKHTDPSAAIDYYRDGYHGEYDEEYDEGWETGRLPLVALHVPCHEEPPEMVAETLRSLAEMDYPRDAYQVFVVDNNTREPDLWEPVETLCDELGFTFLHLEDWPGFKSGALNYALAMTPLEFEIIGVVDADYHVQPNYLRDLIPYFEDEHVAFVQTPQDYRDYRPESTLYQRACYHAYRYFFDVSMPSRNERNAIIFGGTMGLIRAAALRDIGGWDEWCITEDAEASLRLLMRGLEGRFVNQSYGRGLMPIEFDALKRQRFRWCFGGIQILRKHWAALLPWIRRPRNREQWEAPGLTGMQRYHYLVGGLQWYGDTLTFGFTTLLLCTGWLRVLGHPLRLPVLGGPLLLLPLAFWMTSLLRTLWGLRATRRCTWIEAFGAVGIMWSLGWVVTLASVQGLVRKRGVFLRTPKAGRAHLLSALRSTTVETLLATGCLALSLVLFAASVPPLLAQVSGGQGTGTATVVRAALATPWWLIGTSTFGLAVLAFLQGMTYLTAPGFCLLSLRSEGRARYAQERARAYDGGEGILERRLMTGTVVAAALVALLLIGVNALPQSHTATAGQSGALTTLLGDSNPVAATATPSGGGSPTPTTQPGQSPTSGSAPTGTAGATATATDTPHPGASPSPRGTPQATPQKTPPDHSTPTPRPHP